MTTTGIVVGTFVRVHTCISPRLPKSSIPYGKEQHLGQIGIVWYHSDGNGEPTWSNVYFGSEESGWADKWTWKDEWLTEVSIDTMTEEERTTLSALLYHFKKSYPSLANLQSLRVIDAAIAEIERARRRQ